MGGGEMEGGDLSCDCEGEGQPLGLRESERGGGV